MNTTLYKQPQWIKMIILSVVILPGFQLCIHGDTHAVYGGGIAQEVTVGSLTLKADDFEMAVLNNGTIQGTFTVHNSSPTNAFQANLLMGLTYLNYDGQENTKVSAPRPFTIKAGEEIREGFECWVNLDPLDCPIKKVLNVAPQLEIVSIETLAQEETGRPNCLQRTFTYCNDHPYRACCCITALLATPFLCWYIIELIKKQARSAVANHTQSVGYITPSSVELSTGTSLVMPNKVKDV